MVLVEWSSFIDDVYIIHRHVFLVLAVDSGITSSDETTTRDDIDIDVRRYVFRVWFHIHTIA